LRESNKEPPKKRKPKKQNNKSLKLVYPKKSRTKQRNRPNKVAKKIPRNSTGSHLKIQKTRTAIIMHQIIKLFEGPKPPIRGIKATPNPEFRVKMPHKTPPIVCIYSPTRRDSPSKITKIK